MAHPPSINLDATYLRELSENLGKAEMLGIEAKLLKIAANIERLDELSISAYARGFREGEEAHYARSNLVRGEPKGQPNLAAAIEAFRGEITQIVQTEKKEMDQTLTIDDLDL